MKIKTILDRCRRDFTAIYSCEHCGDEMTAPGYDDSYFHRTVIPGMVCEKCGRKSEGASVPMETKYPEGMVM